MNTAALDWIIEERRQVHPELSGPLTWEGVRAILRREGVLYAPVPLPQPARLIGHEGVWVILVDSRQPRRHTYFVAHELGHLWAHVDRCGERWDCVYNMGVNWEEDPREDEAEYVAMQLLRGPGVLNRWG